jgi:hypothetical protein
MPVRGYFTHHQRAKVQPELRCDLRAIEPRAMASRRYESFLGCCFEHRCL